MASLGSWIIPSLLPESGDVSAGDVGRVTHVRCYRCPSIPVGVFGRIMVRVLQRPSVSARHLYRHTMLLEETGTNCVAFVEETGTEIWLRVADPSHKGTLLRLIDEDLQREFRGLFVRWWCVECGMPLTLSVASL